MMLQLESRYNQDVRAMGAITYFCFAEMRDITVSQAVYHILQEPAVLLSVNTTLSDKAIMELLIALLSSLPTHLRKFIPFSWCES